MLQRLLIEKIENRILVGIIMFLGIMVLTGWVAINEPGRMQAFAEQHRARSIERGAELYSANCSTCHGVYGYGILGRAPALNNPSLFGHSFVAAFDREISAVQSVGLEYQALEEELAAGNITSARIDEINARLSAIREQYGEDVTAGIDAAATSLQNDRTAFISQMQVAVDRGYNPEQPSRLAYLGWSGTLESFIQTTLIHGRPTSESYWPEAMVSWSQRTGGPLRDDQIQDLTNFIMNWDRGTRWTIDDLLEVQQFSIRPALPGTETASTEPPIGTDVMAILAELDNYTGDPNNGQQIYNTAPLACAGCHGIEAVAPLTNLQWDLVANVRLNEPQFAGYTVEQYLVESIVNPGAYIVPGYGNAMPGDFGTRISHQQLADILAYLRSYDSGS